MSIRDGLTMMLGAAVVDGLRLAALPSRPGAFALVDVMARIFIWQCPRAGCNGCASRRLVRRSMGLETGVGRLISRLRG